MNNTRLFCVERDIFSRMVLVWDTTEHLHTQNTSMEIRDRFMSNEKKNSRFLHLFSTLAHFSFSSAVFSTFRYNLLWSIYSLSYFSCVWMILLNKYSSVRFRLANCVRCQFHHLYLALRTIQSALNTKIVFIAPLCVDAIIAISIADPFICHDFSDFI